MACQSTLRMLSHYSNAIISAMASQTTSISIVYSTIYWGADQRKHKNSASLGFVRGIHRWPLNSPHKGPVTRKMFSFDVVIMTKKWRHRDFQIMTPYRVIDTERYWFRLWLAVVRRQAITWTDMIYFNRALLNLKCIFFVKQYKPLYQENVLETVVWVSAILISPEFIVT